ncbi:hypothetical protein [Clostridium gasigenes]|uniref:Uncharacterized protein n=1 Tax=Clostridium gasigenes TaxID=94869 RepID=A0A1H0QFG9_9CLOT|nr:hypothetical protein [Clostridium gasigenes]MBB6624493.1 hypothetical protein [Clostridium gasigenes]SDP16141.1 hypothetical protein SAMN04488529_102343 [Clostridium gasigenes]
MIESIYDNDLLFTCSLIEYIGRVTKNEGSLIVNTIGKNGLDRIYQDAEVMHCENIEAVANEFIIDYNIQSGSFDNTVELEKHNLRIPSFWDIGRVYMDLLLRLQGDIINNIIEVYNSYISKCIDDYIIGFYYCNPECIYESYRAGEMLD